MVRAHLVGLMGAYGMTVKLERPQEKKIRFAGNGTFVDVWDSKKGVTLGVYNPDAQACFYKRNMTLFKIEDELIKIAK